VLKTAIPDNGLQLYHTLYAVRSAITATAELLVNNGPTNEPPCSWMAVCLCVRRVLSWYEYSLSWHNQ